MRTHAMFELYACDASDQIYFDNKGRPFTRRYDDHGVDWTDVPLRKVCKTPHFCDVVERRLNRVARKLKKYEAWLERSALEQVVREREDNKKRRAWIREQSLVAEEEIFSSYRELFGIELQAGAPKEKRAEFEKHQRYIARKKAQEAKKKVPKAQREAEVKVNRDKRNPAFQSGKALPAIIGFGACAVVSKLWKLVSKADKAVDNVNAIFKQFEKIAKSLKEHLGSFLWSIPLVMTVYFAIKHCSKQSNLLVAVVVAALAKIVGKKIWTHISKFFPDGDNENVEQQAGVGDFISMAPKLMATLFTFSVLRNARPNSVSEFCKRISMLERMSGGWEVFMNWMLSSLETLVNFARKCFGKERISFFKNAHKPTYEWAEQVDKVCLREATGGNVSPEQLDEMIKLVQVGFAYKELYRGTKMDKFVNDYVARISAALMPYQGALNSKNNFRFEPATLMLYGKPGIGKTLMAMSVCAAVMLESGIVSDGATYSDVIKQVWQKGNSEYWNGYAGQACLVMDDAFQARANVSDKENDYMSIIRMVSTWSFPLNFADLASKGKIYFNSKFIFGTTNLASIDSEARIVIQDPEAVCRRLNFPYAIRVKESYVSEKLGCGKLDYDKFQLECEKCQGMSEPLDRFPWYMWEAAEHNYLTGQTSKAYMPLKEVIMRVSADLRRRLQTHKSSEERLETYIAGYSNHGPPPHLQSGKELLGASQDLPDVPDPKDFAEIVLCASDLFPVLGITMKSSDRAIEEARRTAIKQIHLCAKDTLNDPRVETAVKKIDDFAKQVPERKHALSRFADGLLSNVKDSILHNSLVERMIVSAGSMIIVMCTYMALRHVVNFVWDLLKGLLGFSGKRKGKNKQFQSNRPDVVKTRRVGVKDPQLQSVDSCVPANIYSNSYKMFATLASGSEYIIGQVQFVEGSLAVQPEHFTKNIHAMLSDKDLTLESRLHFRNAANEQHELSFSVEHYLGLKRHVFPDTDVEFVDFGNIRSHKRITVNFLNERDFKYIDGSRARLDICEVDYHQKIVKANSRKVYVIDSIRQADPTYAGGKKISRPVVYNAPTVAGDCGAPLMLFDSNCYSGRTFIGIHVAGQVAHSVGYAAVVTREMVDIAIQKLAIIKDEFSEDLEKRGVILQSGNILPFDEAGSFLPIGTVSTAVSICPKTSYFVTKLYGAFGEYNYQPAHLSPVYIDGVKLYPMENAVAPYRTPVKIFEQKWLRQALFVAMKPFTQMTRDYSRKLFTFDEAVLGIPEEKVRSIPRGTAAGFPYVYDVRNGKKEFFGTAQDYDLSGPKAMELRERVEHILKKAGEGVRLSHVYVDFLKDELRSPEKNRVAATRLISSAPLDYTIAWRVMFGAFSSAAMRTHTRNGMAPGICAYSDWDILVDQMTKHGSKCFDGDFKAFDSSEQPSIHDLILEFINKWYDDGPENALKRRVLWLDMCHSRHIGGRGGDQRYIYQWNKSLPSGHPFTTIINSMYALFCLVAAYIQKTGDTVGFWNHVSSVTYGDDNITNVDAETAEVFNQRTVAEALDELFGMKYTPGDKSGVYQETFDITELTFLKRGFALRDNVWLCPLVLDSFLYTVYWCKNKKLEREIINDNLEGALMELSLHEPRLWDEYAPKIIDILIERVRVTTCIPEQSQYLSHVRSRTDNWY